MTPTTKTAVVSVTLIAFFAGYLVKAHHSADTASSGYQQVSQSQPDHDHGIMDVSSNGSIPTLEIALQEDAMSGWNLHLVTRNFRFAPERASTEHRASEGHAHLYIDGKKIARLYGPWFHIATLEPGSHEIEVTLNANTHQAYAVGDRVIAETTTVVVAAPGS